MNKLKDIRGAMQVSESLALKAVSLLLALILWITILGFKREELKKNVKLEPLLPPGMMITNNIPSYIQFTLSGPRVLLKDAEKRIAPIRPDLRKTRETTIGISITEDLIGELPSGVRVTSFSPPNVLIRLEEIIERYVTVKPTFHGALAADTEIARVSIYPSKIAVLGPRSLVDSLESVGTEPFDIEGVEGSKEGAAEVEVDTSQGLQLSREKVVRIRLQTRRVRKVERTEERN